MQCLPLKFACTRKAGPLGPWLRGPVSPRSGGDQALSPILQVCTDPRFGRMEENFGEDPLLVARAGVAALRGLQGRDGLGGASAYLGSPRTAVSTQAKHFAMYGAGPKDGYTPFGGGPNARTVWEVYLGQYPIVTLEKQLLNMIGKLV